MKQRVMQGRALADYLGLGAGRSLRKLQAFYDENETLKTPSWGTISRWSSVYKWPERARKFDDDVAREMRGRNEEAYDLMLLEIRGKLRESAAYCLQEVVDSLVTGRVELKHAIDVKCLLECGINGLNVVRDLKAGRVQPGSDHLGEKAYDLSDARDYLDEALRQIRKGDAAKDCGS